jgi:DNA-binding transcriptional MerR regulator
MSARAAGAYLGIGEVLAQLRAEFPDVNLSVSKIRFLEAEGLIAPARSPSGYRRFAPSDVQRLRYILTAQRDHYLPLRVIKERLPPGGDAAPGQAQDAAGGGMLSRRELLDAAAIDEGQLAELETFGLVRRVGRRYGQDALQVAAAVAALACHGVEARHLGGAKASAEREAALIEQVVAPVLRQRTPGARDRAGQTAGEIAALTLRLHGALVQAALAEAGLGQPGLPAASAPPGAAPVPGAASAGADRRADRDVSGASA